MAALEEPTSTKISETEVFQENVSLEKAVDNGVSKSVDEIKVKRSPPEDSKPQGGQPVKKVSCLVETAFITGGVSEKVLVKSVTHLVEFAKCDTSVNNKNIILQESDFKYRVSKPLMSEFKNMPFMCAVCGKTFGYSQLEMLKTHVSNVHGFSKRKSHELKKGGGGSQEKGEHEGVLDDSKDSKESEGTSNTSGQINQANNGIDNNAVGGKKTFGNTKRNNLNKGSGRVKGRLSASQSKVKNPREKNTTLGTVPVFQSIITTRGQKRQASQMKGRCKMCPDDTHEDLSEAEEEGDDITVKAEEYKPKNSNKVKNVKTEKVEQGGAIYPKQMFPCDFCDEIFDHLFLLGRHQQSMHKGMKHKCPICEKTFALGRKYGLRQHIRSHDGDKTGKLIEQPMKVCPVCDKGFKHNQGLMNHMKALHPQEFKGNLTDMCETCGKWFTSAAGVEKHQKLVHTTEKPFLCSICGSKFKTKVYLEIHTRRHTGEKPLRCNYCEKRFATYERRMLHQRSHTSEKPYKCTICTKAFASRSVLNIHVNRHTGNKPYACTVCDARFSSTSAKSSHERLHSGIKPYKCSYCDLCFSQKVNMIQHERVHTGDKPFKCIKCDSAFARSNWLKAHLAKKHGIHLADQRVQKCQFLTVLFDDFATEEVIVTSEPLQTEGEMGVTGDEVIETVIMECEALNAETIDSTQAIEGVTETVDAAPAMQGVTETMGGAHSVQGVTDIIYATQIIEGLAETMDATQAIEGVQLQQ